MAARAPRPGYIGPGYSRVAVVSVDPANHTAICRDNKNHSYQIRTDILPFRGAPPQPGEQWLVTRVYGDWTFAHVFNPLTPPAEDPAVTAAKAVLQAQIDPTKDDPDQATLNSALAVVLLALSDRS